jgi:hypothetical protein
MVLLLPGVTLVGTAELIRAGTAVV